MQKIITKKSRSFLTSDLKEHGVLSSGLTGKLMEAGVHVEPNKLDEGETLNGSNVQVVIGSNKFLDP